EARVAEHRRARDAAAAAGRDLHVLRDGADDPRRLQEAEVVLELVLDRLDELLLPLDAVEVRVRVPVANVVERAAAREPLVPGLEVDLRVAAVAGAALVVVVAAVDVDPDAAELVHDLLEAAEVDGDQVVDR